MQIVPLMAGQVAPPAAAAATANDSTSNAVTDAFGLSFEALLKIVLTQLTYQDPLKPMDNFEFVSQLAQFSQIQQAQQTNDNLAKIASSQATLQATGLLGRTVDTDGGTSVLSGTVRSVAFRDGAATFTIQTAQGLTISDLPLSSIIQIKEGN